MTKPLSMTFHESYGDVPKRLLTLYRRFNVSPSDHDAILRNFGCEYGDPSIPWQSVLEFVLANVDNGYFQLPIYM